jgi:hypothetical protein
LLDQIACRIQHVAQRSVGQQRNYLTAAAEQPLLCGSVEESEDVGDLPLRRNRYRCLAASTKLNSPAIVLMQRIRR